MYGKYELGCVLLRKLIKPTTYYWIQVLLSLFMFLHMAFRKDLAVIWLFLLSTSNLNKRTQIYR